MAKDLSDRMNLSPKSCFRYS